LKSLARALVLHQRIKTTQALAKEASRVTQQLITLSKGASVHKRRQAFSILGDRSLVNRLFNQIGPLFKDRQGGYTRIIPLAKNRHGDGARLVLLELTEKIVPVEKKKKPKKTEAKTQEPKAGEKEIQKPKAEEVTPEEVKPEAVKRKEEKKPKKKEEKIEAEETKPKEVTPSKEEKQKGFLGGIRRLFKKKK